MISKRNLDESTYSLSIGRVRWKGNCLLMVCIITEGIKEYTDSRMFLKLLPLTIDQVQFQIEIHKINVSLMNYYSVLDVRKSCMKFRDMKDLFMEISYFHPSS